MYSITTERFSLQLEAEVHEEDLLEPLNTMLVLSVTSDNYSAECVQLDADVYELASFATQLNALYEQLEGEAKFTDAYGSCYFVFTAQRGGHIKVEGNIQSERPKVHSLTFENSFDQTFLRDFAKGLYKDFGGHVSPA